MTSRIDDELRARFDALRAHDFEDHPDFTDLLRRPTLSGSRVVVRHTPWGMRDERWGIGLRRFAAAAALVVIAAEFWVVKMRHPEKSLSATNTATIVSWQSPTAALLQTPARHVLAPPALLSSVLDGVATQMSGRSSTKTD